LDYLRLIADVLEYIEINAARLITVDELAQRCYLSRYHFQRIFHAVARRTLKDYLDERRMYAAAKALRQTDLKVVDIAFEAGFRSHEAFTRRFRQIFGLTPAAYRQSLTPEPMLEPLHLVERDFKNIRHNVVVKHIVKDLPELHLLGRFYRFDPDSMQALQANSEHIQAFVDEYLTPLANPCLYTVTCSVDDEGYVRYFGGAPQELLAANDLEELIIPPCRYAVFQYRGDMKSIFRTAFDDMYYSIMAAGLQLRPFSIELFERYGSMYAKDGMFELYAPVE
jgi:AraC family transcriptional regulator